MSKKRATRSSSKINSENLLEYEFSENVQKRQMKKGSVLESPDQQKPKKVISKSRSQSMKFERKRSSPKEQNQKEESVSISNSMGSRSLNLKKKKPSKAEQNEGIRIIQEKQTQRMFQYLCTPEGVINVESLGRIMVRAKKQFEVEDLQNMIAYFDTIKQKVKRQQDLGPKPKKVKKKLQIKEEHIPSQRASKRDRSSSLNRSFDSQDSLSMSMISESDSESNFGDNLDLSVDASMEINPEDNYKTELNFEEFKLLKKYFDKE